MEEQACKCKKGAPPWMATFADLATLLMCFFVLLLSFSEMDVLKFKQIAGSMKYAFGVQNMLEVNDIPKGTSGDSSRVSPWSSRANTD
ncbi:flagellar motor protein MotB [Photobacterium leiognathi]|uniref:flagellar motor protein MotB n=1 Tax=Photobacterium leiognathi TaxID=553611 RepID=UPI003F74B06C